MNVQLRLQDAGKEKSHLEAISEMSLEDEASKANTACSMPNPDIEAKIVGKKTPATNPTMNANLVTFSRQKLALIQCDYDPKCCHHCGRSVAEVEVLECTKCQTAVYCSKNCRINNWKPKHRDQCIEIRKLKADIRTEERRANVMEMERQSKFTDPTMDKLSLSHIQNRYGGIFCNHCQKGMSEEELKTCVKCKTAKYCSRECQKKDLKFKHKADCNTIISLKEQMEDTVEIKSVGITSLKAIPRGNPCILGSTMKFRRMSLHQERLILWGFKALQLTNEGAVFNTSSESEEMAHLHVKPGCYVVGLCTVITDGDHYIALNVAHHTDSYRPNVIEVWTYPSKSSSPVYFYSDGINSFGTIHYYDGHLLASNLKTGHVHEIHVQLFPFKSTGVIIPMKKAFFIQNMRVLIRDGIKKLVYIYRQVNEYRGIKCVDFEGTVLWELGSSRIMLDGHPFLPSYLCTDDKGRLLVSDTDGILSRVVLIHEDLSLQTIISTSGEIGGIEWANGKLYIVQDCLEKDNMMIATFTISNDQQ